MIDLHMHSTASDGTDSIPELLKKLREAGIDTFAITDHDTVEGSMEMERIVPEDMTFIRGIEFSCITEAGKCHILGYGMDWNAMAFRNALEEGIIRRKNKRDRRIAFLKEHFGIEFTDEELFDLRQMNSVGKPHFGRLLVSKGLASDIGSAIEKYINPCRTESDRLDGAMAVKAILGAGGVPVWAHPLGGTGERERTAAEFEKQLDILMGAGLMGLECYYSKYTAQQIELLVSYAGKNKLCVSGGSDYHGKNKSVGLGTLSASGLRAEKEMLTVLNAVLYGMKNG